MRLDHVGQDRLHALIARLELLNGLLNGRNKGLFAISRHFGMHTIAFASDERRVKKETC